MQSQLTELKDIKTAINDETMFIEPSTMLKTHPKRRITIKNKTNHFAHLTNARSNAKYS